MDAVHKNKKKKKKKKNPRRRTWLDGVFQPI